MIVEEVKPVPSPPQPSSPPKSVKMENAKCAIHGDLNGDDLNMFASALNQFATSNSPPPVSFAYCSNEFCFACGKLKSYLENLFLSSIYILQIYIYIMLGL